MGFGVKMVRKCLNCGRQLRTGRKWCYTCKGVSSHPEFWIEKSIHNLKTNQMVGLVLIFFPFVWMYFNEASRGFVNLFTFWSWFIIPGLIIYFYTRYRIQKIKRQANETGEIPKIKHSIIDSIFGFLDSPQGRKRMKYKPMFK